MGLNLKIWHKLLGGLLVIAGLVVLVALVCISLSTHVVKLRTIELPMEQNLREVDVNIWKAVHSADAFRATGDSHFSDLYQKQVRNVDRHLSAYCSLIDSKTEREYAEEFLTCWKDALAEGDQLLELVQLEKSAENEMFSLVDQADDVIDYELQANMSSNDANILAKERALREVEVSIWEAIHAGEQYTGLAQNIQRAGHSQQTFADLMHQQFRDVDEFLKVFKAQSETEDEIASVQKLEEIWQRAIVAGNRVVSLHDQSSRRYMALHSKIQSADRIIGQKMQAYIVFRISNRENAARNAKQVAMAICIFTIVCSTFVCLVIGDSISSPVALLKHAAVEFGKGNLDFRIASNQKDELGDLTRAFDRMGHELKCSSEQSTREAKERRQAEELLQVSHEYLEAALSQSPSAIIIADAPSGTIRVANSAALELRGNNHSQPSADTFMYAENWQLYRTDGSPVSSDRLPLSVALREGKTVRDKELMVRDRQGNNRWVNANAAPIRDARGQIVSAIVVFHDISERMLMMERMESLAFNDQLTNLPNRTSILRSIQDVIDRNDDTIFAILYLDLDRFKVVNDSLGHDVGDELLKQIAGRIRIVLGKTEGATIPARIGGDEFVVLLDEITSPEIAHHVAQQLHDFLSQDYLVNEQTICCQASIGIVTSEHRSEVATEMLRDADMAMYKSKANRTAAYAVFDQGLRDEMRLRRSVENDMRGGLLRNEFALVYQPIVLLSTGQTVGAEALIRWNHPQRGLINPDAFIPVAEETGMIIPMGNWIINEACRQLAKWNCLPVNDNDSMCIHVNISRKQLLSPMLVSTVKQSLTDHGIRPECLHLELTETVIMDDPQTAISTLTKLKQLGVMIDVDDFGTGYSSLSCLQDFPIDVLKIDRAFLTSIKENRVSKALLRSIITLANQLDLQVVAEGIEGIEQLTMLRSLGCLLGQGYLFAKPMPSPEFEQFLDSTWEMSPATFLAQSGFH